MHEALHKRVQSALALAILDCDQTMAALFDDVAQALAVFRGAPDLAAIDAVTPKGLIEGPGDRLADELRPMLKRVAVTAEDRGAFWNDLLNGLLGFAEADVQHQVLELVREALPDHLEGAVSEGVGRRGYVGVDSEQRIGRVHGRLTFAGFILWA